MDEKHFEKLAEIDARSKSNTHRLDEHDNQLKELSNVYVALTKVDDKVENVKSDVSEIKSDIKEIKDKPTKKIDQIWGYIVSAIISGLIVYLFMKLGLK